MLDLDGVCDDVSDSIGVGTTLEVAEEQAGEVGVHTLVTTDEFVQKCQARHQAPLLEPEDGRERPREEDSLDGGKGYQALSEGRLLVGDPTHGPVVKCKAAGSLMYVSMRRE